jgi:hypothetical protein
VALDEAKAQCRVSHDDEDGLIADDIAAAVEKVGAMAGLVLAPEVLELTVTDPDGDVCLPLVPVTALVSVNGDTDVSGYTLTIDGDAATVSGEWPAGDVVIRFNAGGETAPMLKKAILMLVAHWNRTREAAGDDMKAPPFGVEELVAECRRGWISA